MNHIARKYTGYLEHRSNDLLGIFTANTGKGGCTIFAATIQKHYRFRNFSGLPWCAAFVHAACIEARGKEQARKLLGKPHPGTRVMARRLRRKGRLMGSDYIPRPGDLIFLHNGDGRISHCGIVDRLEGENVISIEGNTVDPSGTFPPEKGGAVAVRTRKKTHPAIVAYGRINKETL